MVGVVTHMHPIQDISGKLSGGGKTSKQKSNTPSKFFFGGEVWLFLGELPLLWFVIHFLLGVQLSLYYFCCGYYHHTAGDLTESADLKASRLSASSSSSEQSDDESSSSGSGSSTSSSESEGVVSPPPPPPILCGQMLHALTS